MDGQKFYLDGISTWQGMRGKICRPEDSVTFGIAGAFLNPNPEFGTARSS